jgi:molecular chaperone DnaK (HSP70)
VSAAAGWVLGVDFGVVNTAAALRDPSGRVSDLRLSSTGVLMPSAVFCPEQQLLVGDGALRAGLSDPGALVPYPKRRLADGMRCKLAVAGQQAYVPGLVAAVFADVRKRAREATGGDLPQDLMLSYPDIHHASFAETSQLRDGLQEGYCRPGT